LNHPAAAVIIKSSWAGREGQPMIVLLCLEACFTSACCSSFRLLFFCNEVISLRNFVFGDSCLW
jgi:hypothetical protein